MGERDTNIDYTTQRLLCLLHDTGSIEILRNKRGIQLSRHTSSQLIKGFVFFFFLWDLLTHGIVIQSTNNSRSAIKKNDTP